MNLRLTLPSVSSAESAELLTGDVEKILGISKVLSGLGGHCGSSCGRAPLGPVSSASALGP